MKPPRHLTKREKNILRVCVVLAIVYAGYHGAVSPLKDQMAVMDEKIDAQQRRLNENLRLIRKAGALKNQYQFYLQRFKQDKGNEQLVSLTLEEIERAANDLNLRIANLKPEGVKRGEFFNRFSVSLTIESDFAGIIHFLHILQSEPHLFSVEQMRLEKGVGRNSPTIKSQITLGKIFISG